jgi:aspartate racemase
MIDVTIDDVVRRGCRLVGVTGFAGAPAVYLEPLRARAVACATIDDRAQAALDAAIHAVAEGRDGAAETAAARAAVATLRRATVDGIVLGCTELPLMLRDDDAAPDLINPLALLAEAAVRFAIA